MKTYADISTEKLDTLLALAMQPRAASPTPTRSVWRKVQRSVRKRERYPYRRDRVNMTLVPLASRLFIDWFGLRV